MKSTCSVKVTLRLRKGVRLPDPDTFGSGTARAFDILIRDGTAASLQFAFIFGTFYFVSKLAFVFSFIIYSRSSLRLVNQLDNWTRPNTTQHVVPIN